MATNGSTHARLFGDHYNYSPNPRGLSTASAGPPPPSTSTGANPRPVPTHNPSYARSVIESPSNTYTRLFHTSEGTHTGSCSGAGPPPSVTQSSGEFCREFFGRGFHRSVSPQGRTNPLSWDPEDALGGAAWQGRRPPLDNKHRSASAASSDMPPQHQVHQQGKESGHGTTNGHGAEAGHGRYAPITARALAARAQPTPRTLSRAESAAAVPFDTASMAAAAGGRPPFGRPYGATFLGARKKRFSGPASTSTISALMSPRLNDFRDVRPAAAGINGDVRYQVRTNVTLSARGAPPPRCAEGEALQAGGPTRGTMPTSCSGFFTGGTAHSGIKSRRSFPTKNLTCGVKLGLRNPAPMPMPMKSYSMSELNQDTNCGASDHVYHADANVPDKAFDEAKNIPRARLFSTAGDGGPEFLPRKKHFNNDAKTQEILFPDDHTMSQSGADDQCRLLNDENLAMSGGRGNDSFRSPHRVSQKGKISNNNEFAFRTNDKLPADAEFYKDCKHMMKKTFHHDPNVNKKHSISRGLRLVGEGSEADFLRMSGISTGSRRHYYDPYRAALLDSKTEMLRQRQSNASRRFVWRP